MNNDKKTILFLKNEILKTDNLMFKINSSYLENNTEFYFQYKNGLYNWNYSKNDISTFGNFEQCINEFGKIELYVLLPNKLLNIIYKTHIL